MKRILFFLALLLSIGSFSIAAYGKDDTKVSDTEETSYYDQGHYSKPQAKPYLEGKSDFTTVKKEMLKSVLLYFLILLVIPLVIVIGIKTWKKITLKKGLR